MSENVAVFEPEAPEYMPVRATEGSAGFDLQMKSLGGMIQAIESGGIAMFDTGVRCTPPAGYYGQIFARSSVAKLGLAVLGGVIDADYTGKIRVVVCNGSLDTIVIEDDPLLKRPRPIAQIVFLPYYTGEAVKGIVDRASARGEGGFGSTDNNKADSN